MILFSNNVCDINYRTYVMYQVSLNQLIKEEQVLWWMGY